jgi:hypothetical protein
MEMNVGWLEAVIEGGSPTQTGVEITLLASATYTFISIKSHSCAKNLDFPICCNITTRLLGENLQ